MLTIQEAKEKVINNTALIQTKINEVLRGNHLDDIAPILTRIDRTGHLPSWFSVLKNEGRLPNLDGKTVGSVIEKLLVCVLEKYIFNGSFLLSVNPARGVDIPELELGVKSPSTNFCTSEPYFSAYERLLGNEYDALVLLTNYQEAKKISPFQLQILQIKYLKGSEIADQKLCAIAKRIREKFTDELTFKKISRFLSYVNQSDWEANCILSLIEKVLIQDSDLSSVLTVIERDFRRKNAKNIAEGKPVIPEESLQRLLETKTITPESIAIVGAAENWVILTQKDNGRYPNDNEWHRLQTSALNGKIGMSFALQWRYNFGCLFN